MLDWESEDVGCSPALPRMNFAALENSPQFHHVYNEARTRFTALPMVLALGCLGGGGDRVGIQPLGPFPTSVGTVLLCLFYIIYCGVHTF